MRDHTSSYFKGMYEESQIPCFKNALLNYSENPQKRTINGYILLSPEVCCQQLYKELVDSFFDKDTAGIKRKVGYGHQLLISYIKEPEIYYKACYFGLGLKTMLDAGFTNKEAWNMYLKMTVLGSYLPLPDVPFSIADAINSQDVPIRGRIDIALYEIQNYLKGYKLRPINEQMQLCFFLPDNEEYVKKYDSWEDFCDKLKFKGSFVDDNYQIVWLTDMRSEPTKENVLEYCKNYVEAAKKRTYKLYNNVFARRGEELTDIDRKAMINSSRSRCASIYSSKLGTLV